MSRNKTLNRIEFIDENIIHIYPSNKLNIYYILDKEDYDKIKNYTWFEENNYLRCRTKLGHLYLHDIIMNPSSNEKVRIINKKIKDFRKINMELVSKNYCFSKRIPSIIIEKDNYIIVIANNTGKEHIFPKYIKCCLENYAWNEDKSGHLHSTINNIRLRAYWFITGTPLKGYVVDHIDRNPRNNMPENLRIVTYKENSLNSNVKKTSESFFKGVSWHKHNQKWQAILWVDGKSIYLGQYDNIINAAKAYDNKKIQLYGVDITTNETLGLYEKYNTNGGK